VLLIGALAWLHVLTEPDFFDFEGSGSFLFNNFNGWLNNASIPGLHIWVGFVFFLAVAVMMISVNTIMRLTEKISYLPALCYVLLIGGAPEIHLFSPAIIATVLLVISFIILAGSFESERLSYNYFSAPIFISLATFFHQYMYVYMLVVWIAIAAWRPGYWREWVFSILGFALPYFFAFSWFFLVEDDLTGMGVFFNEIFTISMVIHSLSVSFIVFLAFCIVLIVFTLLYTLRYVSAKKTTVRTNYYLLILIAAVTIGMAAIIPETVPQAWYLLAFPMTFSFSCYLATVKSMRWGNVVLAFLFVGVVIAQFVFRSTA